MKQLKHEAELVKAAILAAYRKSLIHECVTGQRRVTDEDVRRAGNSDRRQPMECGS